MKYCRHLPILALVAALAAASAVSTLQAAAPAAQEIDIEVHEGTSMSVSVSPDGKWLATDLQGSLWIVPAGGGKARRITDLFNDARQPVWSPDGSTLAYFAFRDGGYDLWTISPDGSKRKKLTEGAFDDRDPAWSPDGRRIAFASDRGTPGSSSYNIWTLELATGAFEKVTDNAYENRMPTWSPDGRQIAYSSIRDDVSALWATTLASGQERQLRKAGGQVDAPSWGPRGELAYVVQGDGRSWLEIDGTPVSGDENAFPFRVSWGRDGDFYYVSDGRIHRRPGVGGAPQPVEFSATLQARKPDYPHARRDFDSQAPRKALGIVRPAISPDGRNVAFVALGDLYLMPVGGTPRKLTDDRYMEVDPAWSPDGDRLVYSSDKGGRLQQLWIRDLKTGKDTQLTDMTTQPLEAVWSPDGNKIAFIDVDGMWGVAGLCVVEVASGRLTRLQPSLGQPGRPTWSGDSQRVALSLSSPYSKSFREGTNQVFVIKADGSGESAWYAPVPNLSIDTRGGAGPVWSPDGNAMAAVYEGELRVWPVSPAGEPLGPPRSVTSEMAHSPSWAGDSKTLLFQSNDTLKKVDIETGAITPVPLQLDYTLAVPAGRTVIHAGYAFDGRQEQLLRDVDIVVDGNRITSIGPHDPARHDASARVIEAPQLTAMPGLIEFHAHPMRDLGEAMHRAWLAWGVTTMRNPGDQPYHGVEDREASEAGVRIGPRIFATGHLLEWQRVYYKMGTALSGPAHLEKELARSRALSYDLLKSYVRLPDLQQRRLVEFAHAQMGVPVTTHEIYPAAFVGVDNTEHMGATSRRGYSPKQASLGRVYQDVVDLFGRTGRPLTPTNFGALVAYLQAHPQLRDDPRLALYPQWAQDAVHNANALPARLKDSMAGTAAGIKAIADAGGRIAAGTDSPIAINLHAEIASYVDAGMTPFQALRSATATSAELLGLDAGTLEAGKLADIVLIEGDPLQDIGNTANVRQVIANGRAFSVEELLHPRE
ncbi:amidohydrolase family protein [Stenotrophomonas sp. MMGLT7]|uniref:amidohydrolase family protein n=1 Tax=Stenotrophomonas sp. MMGLT7 TaxID=2901227 RepID=UPI001E5E52B1|nr:amidohydrolase family protein [Stenotrophomonas sp. MMGLT7]MCD7097602.1 amidohydrolase family protein [Stenotrophomonas sp. MMGLT7]